MSEQKNYRTEDKIEEITLHFGKGTVEPFTAKDGREMLKIVIPNADSNDHSPWSSFVAGQEDGKNIWKDEKTTISNRDLKARVEFYKKDLDLMPKYDIPVI